MTGTFKANIPYNNFLLFVYGLVLKLPVFILPITPVPQKWDAVFYRSLLSWLQPVGKGFPHIYSVIAFLLLYLQAISFNKLVNHQRLLPKPNYLSGMSYLLIASLFPGWYGLHAPLIAATFLIWIVSKLCTLHNNPDSKTTIFNIGLMLGMATLFYFPSIAFLLVVLIGLAITRTFKLPEWLMVFLGVMTPYYFLWAIIFLTGSDQLTWFPTFALSKPSLPASGWIYAAITLLLLTAGVGVIFIQSNMRRLLVQSRKSWTILFIYLLIAIVVPFLNASPAFNYWMLTAVPLASMAASAFFFPDRKWFPLLMHWGMVLLTAVMGVFYVMK